MPLDGHHLELLATAAKLGKQLLEPLSESTISGSNLCRHFV